MKLLVLIVTAITMVMSVHSETTSCGNVFDDTFDLNGTWPSGWTEYSTSGSVAVVNEYLKFTMDKNTPSAYRTFTAVTNNCSCSFDVQGSRTTMNYQMDLVSSEGKYIASIALGKASSDIKYAAAMANAIPGTYTTGVIGTAKFAKNKNYSLSIYIDFINETVDFYNDGVLTLEDIPFLEATTDFAKVDTKLLYMYANNGTVFLDNLTVAQVDEDRINLMNLCAEAQQAYDAATIGYGVGEYLSSDADVFQTALDEAGIILNDCDATTETMISGLADLQTAKELFASSQIVTCGMVFADTFAGDALPSEWTEYNTVDSVRVEDGVLKFNHSTLKPSVYRTFTPISNDFDYTFEVQGSRSSVNCQMHLVSATGKYIASLVMGMNGTATIKYATTMTSSIPAGFSDSSPKATFATNTVYTLSVYADFTNQTVDYYCDGVLMVADVPFLETASDLAKLDVQLLYMYSNSGTFSFDNISLVETSASRVELTNELAVANELLSDAVIGDGFREFPQDAATLFQTAINAGSLVINDCASTEASLSSALTDLQIAEDDFSSSYFDPEALTLYASYNFEGEESAFKCGYYNGTLGDFEDKAVSFTLDAGYMATFAQDVDGLGVSKVYIAQDNDLAINLPEELQRSISFMRVSPWYPVGKKGSLGDVKWSASDKYNSSWYYNWGLTATNSEASDTVQFVPMSWSAGSDRTSLEKMTAIGQDMTLNHHLAFNEPDNEGQSNMTVAAALAAYPKLLASGLRLGAPGVENVQYNVTDDAFNDGAWIQEFMDSCVARGYRVDFIPAHDYVRRGTSAFMERFKALHDRYGIPVWVTEYNYGNPGVGSPDLTVDEGYTHITAWTNALEGADYIERYNWYYFFGASSGIGGITDGELNITGQYYRDLESPAPSYTQEVYEQGAYIATNLADGDNKVPSVTLYPNPITGDVMNVDYEGTSPLLSVKIYDINGKVVLAPLNNFNEINISSLNNGFYILKIATEEADYIKKVTINN